MRVVVAPTAFKGTASPLQAARAIARGWSRARPDDDVLVVPMADGGDGTAEVLVHRLGGRWLRRLVRGPLGEPLRANALMLPSGAAVVEMASASGLVLVPPEARDPLRADTRGTGELIAACLEAGASTVLVGVGGSATTDGGAGAAHALGVRFLDARGRGLEPFPAALARVASVDRSGVHRRAHRIEGLTDVTNPMLGASGAAAVYGPQKGASPADVRRLEAALTRLAVAARAAKSARRPGTGAAGGLGFGIVALLGGSLSPGGERVADLIGLDGEIRGADLVVTGEGRLDRQTVFGKAPFVVAKRARDAGVRCVGLVGHHELDRARTGRIGLDTVVELDGRRLAAGAAHLASLV